jgi:hypothetical protein
MLFNYNKINLKKEDEYAVTGYFGETLVGVRNLGSADIRFTFGISQDVERDVHLYPGQQYDVWIDALECIKQRFMPYIKATEDIQVEAVWQKGKE